MKRETVEKANKIIRKLNSCESALKILESPKHTLNFYLKDYRDPQNPFVPYGEIPFHFEDEEIAMLIEHKKKEIEKLKEELERL